MRELTASEASRGFSAVLDAAERGEVIMITRAGRRVATISPAVAAGGAALRALFTRWSKSDAIDAALADRVADAREAASADLDEDPWRV